MRNRNENSIISQSYVKLGEVGYEISHNSSEGLDGEGFQKKLWTQLININRYLKLIADVIEIKDNKVYRTIGITDVDYNKLLQCLENYADIQDYPVDSAYPFKGSCGLAVISSGQGLQGPPGTNGVSAYSAVVFASDDLGSNFSTTPDQSRKYIAFKSSNSAIPMIPNTFIGLWVKYIAEDGAVGIPGANGVTHYIYIRYANDASGTNFSSSPSATRKYVAFLTTTTDYAGTPPAALFNGLWVKYIGEDGAPGTPGTNGKTILLTVGTPSNLIGTDGDTAIDTLNIRIHFKAGGSWGAGTSLIGPAGPTGTPGSNGTNGSNGVNAYLYIAWADDATGNGYTTVFDPNKDWIAVIQSTIALSPNASDFAGKYSKYRGSGDRWKTYSLTSMLIAIGTKAFVVENSLAYSTGQRVVIAEDGVPGNRMEGLVINYDQVTGQMTVDVTDIFGSGTFASWDVNLSAAPASDITADSYFAELYVAGGATPQALSTSFAKLNAFTNLGDISPAMAASVSTDDITPGIGGEFHLFANVVASAAAGTILTIQAFKNGVAIPGMLAQETINSGGNPTVFSLKGLIAVITGQVYDLRAKASTGTPNITISDARFGMFTTGTPATPEYTKWGGEFDAGSNVVVDAFPTTSGDAVIWEYKVKKGNNIETGRIQGCWDGLGNDSMDKFYTYKLGNPAVIFDVDVNGGNVRLLATITGDDWQISGNRYIL